MSPRLEAMKQRVRNGEHRCVRRSVEIDLQRAAEGLSWTRRAARVTSLMCAAESPVIGPDERIVFTRTVKNLPGLYSPEEWGRLSGGRAAHEAGVVNNVCANWSLLLTQGLLGRRAASCETRERLSEDPEAVDFLDAAIEAIDAVLDLVRRYADEARRQGRGDIAKVLDRVPAHPARTFHEALQSLRICHSAVWLSGHNHVCLGRIDQYLWPFLRADLDAGRITPEDAEELLQEFFISLNRDSDLYPGVQQGDNGQSVMLGGMTPDGGCAVNDLTRMALRASRDVGMIDPKINVRITRDTDLDLLCLAAELTRVGLGFPQYSNDEVVIPALAAHGYDLEDARDYTVAACWEFIIPGKGMEVVNIGAVSFPAAVDRGIHEALAVGAGWDALLEAVDADIRRQVAALMRAKSDICLAPAPFYSVVMDGCLETGRDMARGLKYGNLGIHGAASANAADALAAVRDLVFLERSVAPGDLLAALDADFAGAEALQQALRERPPRVGNHDDRADDLLVWLFDRFADACEQAEPIGPFRRVRPGTGSAMYYVWLARGSGANMVEPVVGATADGRAAGDFFSSSLAPSPGARVRGPISVLQSFAKIDYSRIYNGGPITMELSDALFRDRDAIRKVAMLVRAFAQAGGQQLQLNTLNVETLQDARLHPEKHRDLIVRVWGWSGYFCELDEPYQEQIIARNTYGP